jgi:hypothetical protein
MPDLDYIARKAKAAREFEHLVGAVTFRLRAPTKLESSIAYADALGDRRRRDAATSLRFHRALVVQAVVGWSGITVRHVLPEHASDDAFEFEAGAAEVLFDAQPEWEGELLQALMQRISERQAVEDTAAKN